MKDNNLLDKIKKLHEHAKSAQQLGSVEEAAAFMQKVLDLCNRNKIDLDQVKAHSLDKDPITHTNDEDCIIIGQVKSDGEWETHLIHCICAYNYCKPVRTYVYAADSTVNNNAYMLVGDQSAIEVCKYLFDMCRTLIKTLSNKRFNEQRKKAVNNVIITTKHNDEYLAAREMSEVAWEKDYYEAGETEHFYNNIKCKKIKDDLYQWRVINPEKAKLISYRKVWVRSFLIGAVQGIRDQLESHQIKTINANSNLRALIKTSGQEIENYIQQTWPNSITTKNVKGGRVSDTNAAEQGYEAGKALNINKGVSTSGNGKRSIDKYLE